MSNFNEDEFDAKVAKSITEIRKSIWKKTDEIRFNEWIRDHEDDLWKLYGVSELDCDEELFFSYVYQHSNI